MAKYLLVDALTVLLLVISAFLKVLHKIQFSTSNLSQIGSRLGTYHIIIRKTDLNERSTSKRQDAVIMNMHLTH